ncbi:MAG: DUF3343 domain-containing protein [Ruminococcus sp.]|nr:DUF3343 domain-containing protein [Ruminococcus sp.]
MIVVTFFTHHAAMMTHRALVQKGISAKMAPVPRSLSSSCGSCVFVDADTLDFSLLDEDTEAVYKQESKGYIEIYKSE